MENHVSAQSGLQVAEPVVMLTKQVQATTTATMAAREVAELARISRERLRQEALARLETRPAAHLLSALVNMETVVEQVQGAVIVAVAVAVRAARVARAAQAVQAGPAVQVQ